MKCWVLTLNACEMINVKVLWHKPGTSDLKEMVEDYGIEGEHTADDVGWDGPFYPPGDDSDSVEIMMQSCVKMLESGDHERSKEVIFPLVAAIRTLNERPCATQDQEVHPSTKWIKGLSALEAWLSEDDDDPDNPFSVVHQFRKMLVEVRNYLAVEATGIVDDIELGEGWTVKDNS